MLFRSNYLVAETASGAEQEYGLVWLTDGPAQPVTGEIFTVRSTNASTLTAAAWTNGALTFSQTLPKGRYRVVGMRAQSAGLVAARLVFIGYPWRPGVVGTDSAGDAAPDIFRAGRLGSWGEFDHNTPPSVDFLSVSADTSQIVHLDLQKVS